MKNTTPPNKATQATTTENELQRAAKAIAEGKLPIYLDATTALFLREICEAAGIPGAEQEYAQNIFGSFVEQALQSKGPNQLHGVAEDIRDGWELKDDARIAMFAVVERWNAA